MLRNNDDEGNYERVKMQSPALISAFILRGKINAISIAEAQAPWMIRPTASDI